MQQEDSPKCWASEQIGPGFDTRPALMVAGACISPSMEVAGFSLDE